MTKATVLTDRFDRALMYATHVHGGQVRKGTSTPYVAHLLAHDCLDAAVRRAGVASSIRQGIAATVILTAAKLLRSATL